MSNPGVSLRDYFAARAMAATIARLPLLKAHDPNNVLPCHGTTEHGAEVRRGVAILAYAYADAMLHARVVTHDE